MKFFLKNIEEIFSFVIFSFMALLAFANVLTRYLFNYPIAFTEEIEVGAMVWLTLFGAAIGFKRGSHLGISFLTARLPNRIKILSSKFALLLTLGLFGMLIYFCCIQIIQEIELRIISESLGLPQWIYTAGIPIGSLFILLRVLEIAFKRETTFGRDMND
ncbi:MAG: TRAP transporter small permease [Nitrospirae bacterium]|nr:TRAP transporter small permease [Nitrospirota bacterium]